MADRVKVACINWTHADAPHAISYVLRDDHALADAYHGTWSEAMERANGLAVALGLVQSPTESIPSVAPILDHQFMAGRFGVGCQVMLARYRCPYPPEMHPELSEPETGAHRG